MAIEEVGEVVVGSWHAVDEVFEDDGEFLYEFLGLVGEGEGTVVHGSEVEVVEDLVDVILFASGLVWCYDFLVGRCPSSLLLLVLRLII